MLDKTVLQAMADGIELRSSPDDDSESEFLCPRCYGSHFGSSLHGTPNVEYHCHDEFERGCSWSGNTSEAFIRTYSYRTLAAELLASYKKIEELEANGKVGNKSL